MRGTRGTETSNYPEEKKVKTIPKVVASEIGPAQTTDSNMCGVKEPNIARVTVTEYTWKGKSKRVKVP